MQLRVNTSPSGRPGRVFVILFGLLFMTVGLIFTVFIGGMVLKRMEVRIGWEETFCQILSIEADTSGSTGYHLRVGYTYTFEGGRYTGHVLQPDQQEWDDFRPVQVRLLKYRKGSRHPCWVNPKNPEEAVLERGEPFFFLLIFFPLIFVFIGGAVLSSGLRVGHREAVEELGKTGMDRAWKRRLLVLVFLVLIGGSLAALFLMREWLFGPIEARSWVRIPAEVEQSRLRCFEGTDSDGRRQTTWKIDILYSYQLEGQRYRSNRYGFFTGSSSGRSSKEAVIQHYQPGTTLEVWVDPEDPTRAVIRRDWSALQLLGLIPLVTLAIGVFGLLYAGKGKKTGSSFPVESFEDSGALEYAEYDTPPDGPLVLTSGTGRWVTCGAFLFFGLFWNGIISVFVVQVIRSFHSGHPNWLMAVFMTPFVVVGIGVILKFFHSLLALSNPKTTLSITRRPLHLGEETLLRWKLSGKISRLESFRIILTGSEKATYRRGTNTHTDTEEFRRITVYESPGSVIQPEGHATLVVPEETMHTFKASNNQIVWNLLIEAEIPRWPDIADSWEIEILPQAAEHGEQRWNT